MVLYYSVDLLVEFYRNSYSVVQTASDCAEQRFTKMSSTEAGKSPPAKRRRTVADVKVQTIMTQEEIDHLDSPVWTVSFLFYKLL